MFWIYLEQDEKNSASAESPDMYPLLQVIILISGSVWPVSPKK